MQIQISDPRAAKDLTRFFRSREYLAVERTKGVLEVVPIQAVGQRADRRRTLRDLAEWAAANPEFEATPMDEPG
jgi:hypothetical protein